MNDLISRSALVENATVMTEYDEDGWGFDLLAVPLCDVKAAPAVDAVEVVRCKDCKAWNTKTAMSFLRDGVHVRCCTCSACGRLMHDDDFCSYGKRRADE